MIRLLKVTPENVNEIIGLSDTLSEEHNEMVAPNVVSLAQAYAYYDSTYVRAIYNDDVPVGFAMFKTNYKRKYFDVDGVYLVRLMIATDYQGKGYGKQAIDLFVDYFRKQGKKHFDVTSGQGQGSPLGFYLNYGFKNTGEIYKGALMLHLDL